MFQKLSFLFLFLILTWTTLDTHCGYLLNRLIKSNMAKLGCLEATQIKKIKIIEDDIS